MRFVANQSTDNMLRIALRDASGAGQTGLCGSTADLATCVEWLDGTPVLYSYSEGDGNTESISTLGTCQAPSTDTARFEEVSNSCFSRLYELHFAD